MNNSLYKKYGQHLHLHSIEIPGGGASTGFNDEKERENGPPFNKSTRNLKLVSISGNTNSQCLKRSPESTRTDFTIKDGLLAG